MTCAGHKERDICPYRFEGLCFYTEYTGNDVEPCKNQHFATFSIGTPLDEPLTPEDIERGMREVEAFMARRRLRVIDEGAPN